MDSGACANIVLILGDTVFCANIGDCRSVICRNGKALCLSQDHKPTNAFETKRIKEAGGHIECGRVNGRLSVSRAFGDFKMKKEENSSDLISVEPDIRVC